MTTKKSKSASRTKTGALDKKAVVEAIKNVSTTRNYETTDKKTPVASRDSMSGKSSQEIDIKKYKESNSSSESRARSFKLKLSKIQNAIVSISKSRKTEKK